MENTPVKKTNDHLANERTFLAWIRTAIGIMGFGFVVVKFSLFIKQISLIMEKQYRLPQTGYSATIGVILVAFGALTALFAFVNYLKIKKDIESTHYTGKNPLVIFITCCILFVSALLLWYLMGSI